MIQYLVMKLLTKDSCSPIVLLIGNWELIRCQCILIGFSLFILIRLPVIESHPQPSISTLFLIRWSSITCRELVKLRTHWTCLQPIIDLKGIKLDFPKLSIEFTTIYNPDFVIKSCRGLIHTV